MGWPAQEKGETVKGRKSTVGIGTTGRTGYSMGDGKGRLGGWKRID